MVAVPRRILSQMGRYLHFAIVTKASLTLKTSCGV